MNGLNTSQLNRAISHGATEGVFSLPKGLSGKVKLAPKKVAAKETATKEVRLLRHLDAFHCLLKHVL